MSYYNNLRIPGLISVRRKMIILAMQQNDIYNL